jgi:hypothetical protein
MVVKTEKEFLDCVLGRLDAIIEYSETFKVDEPLTKRLKELRNDVIHRKDKLMKVI